MAENKKPLVSVGLPVYNGERLLRLALESILTQDYKNFELIISDNASTDTTADICRQYMAKDSRIRYVRNDVNLGAAKNFNRVFELAAGKYFMWTAHDNMLDETYISKCIARLEQYPTAVLCFSDVAFVDENGRYKYSNNNLETVGMSMPERVKNAILNSDACPIYGIVRPEALKRTRLFTNTYGSDTILLLELSLLGDFIKVSEQLYYFRIPDQIKAIHEYMASIDPAKVNLPTPYTDMMREVIRVVFDSNLNAQDKLQIFSDFVENISLSDYRLGFIREENPNPLKPVPDPLQLRDFIRKLLIPDIRKLKDTFFKEGFPMLGSDPPHVLIGCIVRQNPAALRAFLNSLTELNRSGCYADCLFIDNNDNRESSSLLANFVLAGAKVFLETGADKDFILKYALNNNYTHVMIVDADLILHPLTLKQLLLTGKDIVSEIFWTIRGPDRTELPQVWISGQNFFHAGDNSISAEEKNRRTSLFINQLKVPGLYQVSALGGCTLISAKAIAKGVNYQQIGNADYPGEDRHFCIRAVILGFNLYVDTHVPALHICREPL